MTVYTKSILTAFQLEDLGFALDDASRRRLMAISAIPFLAVSAMVAQSWLTVDMGRFDVFEPSSEAMQRGELAAASAAFVLTPLSLAVLLGASVLELTDVERKWTLALAGGAALVALGFAVTVVVMSLGLGRTLAFDLYFDVWGEVGAYLGLMAAGYVFCARPRRRSAS